MSKQILLDMIASMESDGLVDSQFRVVDALKEKHGPLFMIDLITKYCSDARDALQEMTKLLEESSVDFHRVQELCFKLKGGSSCIGACKIAIACADCRQAAEDKSKDRCILSLNYMKHEFGTLQDRFDDFVELDRRIAQSSP